MINRLAIFFDIYRHHKQLFGHLKLLKPKSDILLKLINRLYMFIMMVEDEGGHIFDCKSF